MVVDNFVDLTEELTYIEQLTEEILDKLEEQGINSLEAILYARAVLEELE